MEAYARRALEPSSTLPGGEAAAVGSSVLEGPLMIIVLAWLLLLFPDGRLPSQRWRSLAILLVADTVLLTIASALAPGNLHSVDIENPIGLSGTPGTIAGALTGLAYVTAVVVTVVAAVSLVRRYRRSTGTLRQQFKWFGSAGALLAVSLACGPVLWVINTALSNAIWTVLFLTAITTLPVATGIAVLRYRLYEIDVIIRRTVTYTVLVVILGACYLAGIWLLGGLLRSLTGASGAVAVTITTLAVWAGFQPLRARVQTAVDRRFARQRYDAGRALAGLSSRLRDRVELESIEGELLALVDATVQPRHASLWLRAEDT